MRTASSLVVLSKDVVAKVIPKRDVLYVVTNYCPKCGSNVSAFNNVVKCSKRKCK